MALKIKDEMKQGDPPVLLLSGGECTVTFNPDKSNLKTPAIGGPNAEFMLSAFMTLKRQGGHLWHCLRYRWG